MKVKLTIYNGYLNFVPESVGNENLRSWLENMATEDMMHGEWEVEIDVWIEWLPDSEGSYPILKSTLDNKETL